MKLSMSSPLSLPYLSLFLLATLFHSSQADVGTAGHYSPLYLPTSCFGSDASQFPSSNLFGSAGEGIWDNGAACGRQYLGRCISAAVPKTCIPGKTIQIKDSRLWIGHSLRCRGLRGMMLPIHGAFHNCICCHRQRFCFVC